MYCEVSSVWYVIFAQFHQGYFIRFSKQHNFSSLHYVKTKRIIVLVIVEHENRAIFSALRNL
jgi:hypothetical protein